MCVLRRTITRYTARKKIVTEKILFNQQKGLENGITTSKKNNSIVRSKRTRSDSESKKKKKKKKKGKR